MATYEKHVHVTDPEHLSGKESPPVYSSTAAADINHASTAPADEVVRTRRIQTRFVPFRALNEGEIWLNRRLGIETQGVDRIPEQFKQPPAIWNIITLWCGTTLHVGVVPVGVLGPEFGLSLGESCAAIVVGTFLGALCAGFCGTLGPKLGMRSIATCRYSFGFYGAKLPALLNVITSGGFAVVNIVVAGQLLSAVSDYTMTVSVGCVIVGVLSYIVSIFGFRVVQIWEKYCWIVSFILLLVLVGQATPYDEASIPAATTGLAHAGIWLSFFAICFASSAGWCSFCADYYCNYPATTKSWKVFLYTVLGLTLPVSFATIVGAVIANGALLGQEEPFYSAYSSYGLGGLIRETYHPLGWSKFCLVILTFTVIGNNVVVFYSSGLALQLLGDIFHAVPRFIWSFLDAVVITVLAIAGKEHLSTIVSNFVSLLGYWSISFTLILLIEDQFFRRRTGYNLEVWDAPSKLPWGVAAIFALLVGYLCGGVTGMVQTWYIGPIAQKFGTSGGDVGNYLAGVFTLVVYPIARHFEIKVSGR